MLIPSVKDLPPLVSLRAFEATARHLSATRAAAELHVTLGAVSHQVRVLEEFLGKALFVRGHRQLTLTPQGQEYFASVAGAFEALRSSTNALRKPGSKTLLKVRAYTTYSLRWLIPRLSGFYASHPGLELVLSVSNDEADFSRDGLDFAIRLGAGEWPGAAADRLLPNIVAPVCSPAYLKVRPAIRTAHDLKQHVLLQSTRTERSDEWPKWLQAQGVARFEGYNHLYFESSALTYEAAIEGHGIAMGQLSFVQRELADGRLVRPFDSVLDTGPFTYYLTYPAKGRLGADKADFRNWLIAASHEPAV